MAIEKDFNQQITDKSDSSLTEVFEGPDVSRRKFTRNVLVGSAVLLTLSNRSAWAGKELICASATLLESYRIGNPSSLTDCERCEAEKYLYYENEAKTSPQLDPATGDMCYERTYSNDPSYSCDVSCDVIE